ncbi:MAG: PIN domain nuclease [Candidatus Omnitrophica bacterium]|nr:PIN domain nuclease [Candidatus Omnitrophota bacterium]
MKKMRLYLDASIINFALAEDIPLEEKEITKKLCKEINKGKFDGFISEVVLREIANTKDPLRRDKLVKFIRSLELEEILEVNNEIDALAEKYINEKIIPVTYRDDALHIALTSVNGLDILVSWNFKHLVKHKTRVEVTGVNTLLGYKNIDICAPWEVIEDV